MSGTVELSVIIVSHGHERMLPACIDALRLGLAGLTAEIIVIDNLQSGAVAAALRGADVRLVENKAPVGFAANVNSGAAIAVGSRILLLNPDTRHQAGRLADIVAFLDARPDVGVVGCTLLNPDGTIQQSYRRFPTLGFLLVRGLGADRWPWQPQFYRRGLMEGEPPHHAHPVDWVFGAFMLLRRADFERLGGMDESFRLYYEDVDLCHRFRGAGLATYVIPEVRLVHDHIRASAASPLSAAWRWHVASAARYFWKTRPRRHQRLGG